MSAMPDPICPDCGHALSIHELFPDGRCPVVRFPGLSAEQITEIEAWDAAEVCPNCEHSDQHHDENGCDVDGCECLGP